MLVESCIEFLHRYFNWFGVNNKTNKHYKGLMCHVLRITATTHFTYVITSLEDYDVDMVVGGRRHSLAIIWICYDERVAGGI